MNYTAHVKGGRCWNGGHRDRGQVVHAVTPARYHGDHFDTALCGAEPGRTSYGWTESEQPINCPKCLKKMKGSDHV